MAVEKAGWGSVDIIYFAKQYPKDLIKGIINVGKCFALFKTIEVASSIDIIGNEDSRFLRSIVHFFSLSSVRFESIKVDVSGIECLQSASLLVAEITCSLPNGNT